ncbi:MAG: S8 family serine peptidase, partial [Oscillospiraceae bacterium]
MTVCKRIGAWLLTLVLLVSALPYTAFAASEDSHVVNATMEETSVEDIASNVTTQLLRGAKTKDETLSMEAKPTHEDSDSVEIIVVVDDSVAKPTAQAQVQSLLQKQEKAAATMSRAIGEAVEPERQYTTLLNGFSATVTYGQYKALKELDCVESVFLSPTFSLLPDTANSTRMIGGGLANETGFTGEGMLIAILDTGVDMDHQIFSKAPANPALTQDDVKGLLSQYDFQAEGFVKGLSVSSVYKSAKFPFQFDYGDKDTDGAPGTKSSHGTHVASTAAGCTGINADVQGVAPDAQIANMNVFNSSGSASYADILSALEDCMLLGVDVANLSLGSDAGYIDYENPDEFTESLLNVFKRAGESGMSLAVAAGNAYSAAYGDAFGNKALASNPDYGLISEPSTYGESMSVAAVSNSKVKSPYITVGGRDFAYQDSGTISTDENAKIFRDLAKKGELKYAVVPGYGTEDDYEGIDVSGKVALVQRGGGMYYEQKERSAYAHGAIAMLVYNNVPGMLYMSITDWKMPCAFISQEAGEYLKAQENKVLTVGAADKLVASPTYGMADFSSWGATTELTLKPEITAPGAGIYAAVPGNAYESMDGTSMASPHAAGAMAIVQQALKARGMTDATQRKHMVDTLLMSTASIIYDSNGQPYSPRKQGAGLININDAVKTEGYLTVDGMIRPKLELGDDPAEKGVYTMTFKVHNTGKDTLYYDIQPIVLTDGTATYTNSDNEAFLTSSETAVALSHTFTTNCKDNRVAVPAGSEQEVTVTVTLTNAKEELKNFENGAYVEGFVTLKQVAADGGKLEDAIDLGIPYLAFYGDWTKAPIIDSTDYWQTLDGTESKAQAYMNTAFTTSAEGQIDTYLGDNNYANVPYFADHNAISPDNSNDMMDSLTGIYTGLLRNTKTLKYTITDQKTGEVYLEKTCDYVNKSIYSYDYYRIVPAGVNADYTGIDAWYGTAKNNSKLPNNTKATVTIEATLPYGDGGTKNLKNSWSFPITIDNEDPHASNLKVTEAEGRYYLSLDVSDNQYVSAIVFYNLRNSDLLYGIKGFSETTPGLTTHVKEYDVTGMGETFGMIVHDYAGNSKSYTVKVPGNSDDYGIVKPTNVLWTETFDNDWLPADWSMESKGASVNTWYRDVDYTATVDADNDFQQNEWLYSRATDISGVETDVHMIFNFYTTPVYTVDYKRCNLQVMASADGQTWEEVWNLQKDAGAFTAWAATQAKVTIPEKFQNCDDLRFAFVYTGKGGAQISVDNVQLYADVREDYIAVTATSGEGGAIDPAGTTLVKKGTSKTFNVVPATGYEVANVVVDGIDLGPIAYYTFERVGTDHTISATFQKAQAGGEIAIFSVLTTVAGEGGAVQPAGQTKVATGETVNVTFVPDEGYQLASVKVNGRKVEVTDNTYALTMDQNYAVTADFEAIPDVPQVMFENDFESVSGDKFPFHGWTLKGQNTNSTWKQYTYYNWKSEGNDSKHAYITNDWDGAQDEYLISPVVDLSATRDGVLTFDFAYGEYGIKNKTFTATVEVSTDGGKTWNAIWNFQDSYTGQQASNYIISGSAEVPVPAEYNVAGVQFAFRYVHPHEDTTGQLAIDNVKLMAVETGEAAQKYTIAATAGEGGSITPNGDVSVKEGASQTFAITADNGYEIADVLVDGNSVGAVETYTFDEVKANHTISASFSKTTSAAEFDNDFEQDEFPGHGWAVKSSRTDTPYTWYKGTNTTLNSSKQARIDMDYYESSGWGDWGSKSAQPLSGGSDKKQDEYLISPVVDLTGKTPTLSFDYLLHRYTAYNYCAFTVEASTDGGSTWTAIWNAKVDLAGMGGSYLSGTAKIEVPEAYLTGNVQFAFHLAKKAGVGYDDDDAMFAIDNVKLTNTDPCADGHAYGEPVWSWTDDFKATATFTCANNDAHVENVTATVTNAVTTEATCEVDGVRTYTAKVTFEGKEYTDTKTETLPATGHAYGEPVWKWNDDFTASATFTCANDTSHVKNVTATVTNEVTTEATCEVDGVRTYTAKVTFEGKEYTDTKTEVIPATDHDTELVGAKDATCTEDGYTG